MKPAKVKDLRHALKEWAIAVDALSAGKTIVLLRKGGIREAGFKVKYPEVWLYPTYEHQKPHLLKPEYASEVAPVESGWHPHTVTIKSFAEVTEVLPLSNRKQIEALQPYHIWNEQMMDERLKWKPQQPTMVLLLKVYCLRVPQSIPYNDAYGGCKSWIDLLEPIARPELIPAIANQQYQLLAHKIKALLESPSV
jgi:hypothetical protein